MPASTVAPTPKILAHVPKYSGWEYISAVLTIIVTRPWSRQINATANAVRQFPCLEFVGSGRVESRGKKIRKRSNLKVPC